MIRMLISPDTTWSVSSKSSTVPTKVLLTSLYPSILRNTLSRTDLPSAEFMLFTMSFAPVAPEARLPPCGMHTLAPGQTFLTSCRALSTFTAMRSAGGVSGSSSDSDRRPILGMMARRAASPVDSPGRALLRNITRPSERLMASTPYFAARGAPADPEPSGTAIFTTL